MGVDVDQLDAGCSIRELNDRGIEIQNISSTFSLPGEFDISKLASDLPYSEYDPDKHRSLIYRPPEVDAVILLPPRGRVSITGVPCGDRIHDGIDRFISDLDAIGVEKTAFDIQVENTVATADMGESIDLYLLSMSLGLEKTEYEPEQFPGLIYRTEKGVFLVFSSGKIVITSVETYSRLSEAHEMVKTDLSKAES
jgi:transcription initiation factor TFIID TATA-box-binding protein